MPGPSLFGRSQELEFLKARLRRSAAGAAGCVVLVGEPGIGKTALLQSLAGWASSEGFNVIQGGAFEAEGMPPYLLFLEALGPFLRTTDSGRLRMLVEGSAATLASIFPELPTRLGSLEAGYPLPADQARLRLFEAVADFLAAIAASAPLVLVLDDLHWADRASLDLLCHVVRYQPNAPLLIVGAYREGEASANPALDRALDELTRLRRLDRCPLQSLGPVEMGALCRAQLGEPADERTVRRLWTQSEGNPFFAEELLRDWREAGLLELDRQTGEWGLTRALPPSLPASIAGAVRQRLARLPTENIDPLRVASILGRSFAPATLADLLEQPEESLESMLRPALRAGLLKDSGTGLYAFGHEMIREVLYGEVSASRRQRLHERIGLALEAQPGPPDPQRLSALAFHFARSPDRARGARYCREAGLAALRSFASEEAVGHFEAALRFLDPADTARPDTLVGLGEACLLSGSEEKAAAHFQETLRLLKPGDDPVLRARAAHGLGRSHWRRDALEDARWALEEGLRELGEMTAMSEAVLLRVDLATLLGMVLGRMQESLQHAEKALVRARGLRDPRWQAPATRTFGFLMVLDNRLPEGQVLLEEALRLAEAADDPAEAAEVCSALAQTYAWQGLVDRSREISLRREAFALRCRQPYPLRYVYSWLAFLDSVQGSWLAASTKIEQATSAVMRMASHRPAAFLDQVRGFLAYQRGDFAEAELSMRSALETFRAHDPLELILCLGTLALALRGRGKSREAAACREDLTALLGQVSSGGLAIGSARSCLGLLAIADSDAAAAADLYPLLLPFRGQHHWFLVDRVLGGLAVLLGDLSAAEVHLREAAATATRERIRPEHARLLVMQAGLARLQGKADDQVEEALEQARALFLDLHLQPEADAVVPASGFPRKAYPAGLSRREVQILALVAQGLSNNEIAASLALSPHTVAKHLTSIFNKVGVDNRAGAVAFALRNGLA